MIRIRTYQLGIFLLILQSLPRICQAEAFFINTYNVVIVLGEEGYFDVTETIDLEFTEQRRGIIRDIETVYTINGKRTKINIRDVQVNGWNFQVTGSNGTQSIKIGDADKFLMGPQQYRISYRVEGAVLSYDDHHEFYWNLIGTSWLTDINESSFTFEYPASWVGQIVDFKAMYGPANAVTTIPDTRHEGNRIIGVVPAVLSSKEGLTLSVAIPKELLRDQVVIKSNENTAKQTEQSPEGLLFIPIVLASGLFFLWKRNRIPSEAVSDQTPQYYAPDGISPALVGAYYDHRVNRRDLIALLPYWGELGCVKIFQSDDPENIQFVRLKVLPTTSPAYERELFDAIFEQSDTVRLSDVNEKLYTTMASVASAIKRDILDKELYDLRSYRIFHSGWMIGAFVLCLLLGILMFALFGAVVAGIGLLILGVLCIGIHFMTPQRSEAGERFHRQLRNLYEHLKQPEPDILADLISKNPNYLFELFPYVLAFGLDQTWIRQMGSREIYYPEWYVPMHYGTMRHHGQPATYQQFAKDFNPRAIEQAFYSTPVPTGGGGGYSGGGSVGGGFGGGGGSSW